MSRFVRKFYVSDTHFGHENIIGHSSRPFSSVDEMDRHLIDSWNSVVSDNDIVYHLGDFSVPDIAYAKHIFNQLRGRKILILGNHDELRSGVVAPHIAALDWDRPPVDRLVVSAGNGRSVFLSHYAHRTWPGAFSPNSFHFYGHCHGSIPHLGRSRDVGVDLPDVAFRPRTFDELAVALPGLPSAVVA